MQHSLARPSSLSPLSFAFFLSLSLYLINLCKFESVWLTADRFGQGSGPAFSPLSLINHLSPQSLALCVCVCDLVLVCFCLHSSAHTFVFISRCCLIFLTFTLTDRYSKHVLHLPSSSCFRCSRNSVRDKMIKEIFKISLKLG